MWDVSYFGGWLLRLCSLHYAAGRKSTRDLSLLYNIQSGSHGHLPSHSKENGGALTGSKTEEHVANHLIASSADVKNNCSYTATPPILLHGVPSYIADVERRNSLANTFISPLKEDISDFLLYRCWDFRVIIPVNFASTLAELTRYLCGFSDAARLVLTLLVAKTDPRLSFSPPSVKSILQDDRSKGCNYCLHEAISWV
jgi:hypothetical protein